MSDREERGSETQSAELESGRKKKKIILFGYVLGELKQNVPSASLYPCSSANAEYGLSGYRLSNSSKSSQYE